MPSVTSILCFHWQRILNMKPLIWKFQVQISEPLQRIISGTLLWRILFINCLSTWIGWSWRLFLYFICGYSHKILLHIRFLFYNVHLFYYFRWYLVMFKDLTYEIFVRERGADAVWVLYICYIVIAPIR